MSMFSRWVLSENFLKHFIFNYKSVKLKHQWLSPEGYDTGIRVYNRITNGKVPLVFLNKHFVKWYICGPTVYDVSHIGHASCYIRFDILNRILQQFFDIKPIIALGITDIDDKIIARAHKLGVDFKSLAKKYELEFFTELNQLNILPPSFVLRVSDYIPEIIEFVSKIIEKKKGYKAKDGSVYFDRGFSKDEWKLIQPPSEGASALKEGQKSYLDFALWKGAKTNEPFWESPWGKGRPGWHIECSAMASKVFGSKLDLHGGGIDLVFPHHENEEFQSCCYHDCNQWVNYWLHTGHLEVQGEKMSKSLNNYISISEFLEKYTADNLRMFCFITHYRKGLHFSSDGMELPVAACNIISRFFADCNSYIKGNWSKGNISESSLLEELAETSKKVKEHLMDDFDTGKCYLNLMELIKNTMKKLNEETNSTFSRSPTIVAAISYYVNQVFKSFGFQFDSIAPSQVSDINKLEFIVNHAVNFRSQVRGEALSLAEKTVKQNFLKSCDSFRNELATLGIDIKDQGKNSSSWSFIETKKVNKESQEKSTS